MSDEIEQFLRQAAAKKRNKPQPDIEFLQPAQPPQQQPLTPPPTSGVSAHVEQYLDSDNFQERASHMGEQVGLADEKLEARLHETFDHALGQLQDTSHASQKEAAKEAAARKPAQPGMPGHLAEMLRSPRNVSQAIILSEILTRPEQRWQNE